VSNNQELHASIKALVDNYCRKGYQVEIDAKHYGDGNEYYDSVYRVSKRGKTCIIQLEESDDELKTYIEYDNKSKLLGITYLPAVENDLIMDDIIKDLKQVFGKRL
jgi:hypothetical protein